MRAYTEGTGFDLQYVADNYPWADFGNGTVVDVGGLALPSVFLTAAGRWFSWICMHHTRNCFPET